MYGMIPKANTVKRESAVMPEGRVPGLGNDGAIANLAIDATATAVCVNHGGNVAPGQDPVSVAASGSQVLPPSRNGAATLNVSATADYPAALRP